MKPAAFLVGKQGEGSWAGKGWGSSVAGGCGADEGPHGVPALGRGPAGLGGCRDPSHCGTQCWQPRVTWCWLACMLCLGSSTPTRWGDTGVLPLPLWGRCQGQTQGPSRPSASRCGHGRGGSEPAQGTLPSLGAPGPCMLQEEARHTAIKNITSGLFGICYSVWVTGYKYILQ